MYNLDKINIFCFYLLKNYTIKEFSEASGSSIRQVKELMTDGKINYNRVRNADGKRDSLLIPSSEIQKNLQKTVNSISVPLQGNPFSGSMLSFAWGYAAGYHNYLSDEQAMNFYRKSSAVATAVDKIADEVHPNDFETYTEFIGSLVRNYLITRNSFLYIGGMDNQPPAQLYSIKPQNVSIYEGNNGYPQSFLINTGIGTGDYALRYTDNGARYFQNNLEEISQITGYSSNANNIHGDSPLLAICMEIAQQIKGKVFNISLLDNGGRPSLFVKFNEDIDVDEARSRMQFMREQIGGESNAGHIMGGYSQNMDVIEMGKTNKDMDFFNLDMVARNAIYLKYKIPLPLISNDASTYNNIVSSTPLLYDWAVIPTFNTIFRNLSLILLPKYGLDTNKVEITYNPEMIAALTGRRLEELRIRKELNLETRNELREYLPGREPLDENSDVVYQAANLVPAGKDIYTDDNSTTTEEESKRVRTERTLREVK